MSAIEYTAEDLERAMAPGPWSAPRVAPFDPHVVAREIAAKYGVTYQELMSKGRFGNLPHARHALWSFLRRNGWSTPQIGRFAQRDHTTVLYALHKFDGTRPKAGRCRP